MPSHPDPEARGASSECPSPALTGTLSPSDGEREGVRGLAPTPPPTPVRSAGSGASMLDDLATVIFSSGSTGEPKGVMLSHYNIGSNIEQLEQIFGLNRRDCVLGVLPFFHSFGFTGTLCLPAVLGVRV